MVGSSGGVMKGELLKKLAELISKNYIKVCIGIIISLIVSLMLASNLKLKMQFKNMMPQNHPTVKEYDKIINNYSSASNIILAANGDEKELKSFVDEIVPEIKKMDDRIKRIDYKIDKEFIENHGMLLTKKNYLKNSKDQYKSLLLPDFLESINNSFEKTYVGDSESISNKEKEDQAIRNMDGLKYWLETMDKYLQENEQGDSLAKVAVDKLLIGDEYFLSPDKSMIVVFIQPTFTVNEVDKTIETVNHIDSLIAKTSENYSDVEAGLTGLFALTRDETIAASEDMFITSILAFVLIIALFIFSFRMWSSPVLAGTSLIIGIIWASGFAAITVESLNMMTSMFSVILIGLGIDFNIHIISGYSEYKSKGMNKADALKKTFEKSGNGVLIGAITTSIAFFTMLVSENAGMKEFAIVAGSGVLFCMISAFVSLPTMLMVRERIFSGKVKKEKSIELNTLANITKGLQRNKLISAVMVIAITIFLFIKALDIKFNYDYLSLEPEGLVSVKLQDDMIKKFDASPDMTMVTTSNLSEARRIAEEARDLHSIGLVNTITDFIPSAREYSERIEYVQKIKSDLENIADLKSLDENNKPKLIDELYRLEYNLIELAQLAFNGGQDKVDHKAQEITGDLNKSASERNSIINRIVKSIENNDESIGKLNEFQEGYYEYLQSKALRMCSTEQIELKDLPQSIKSRFLSKDGNHYLISMYPKQGVWNFEFLARFTDQMHKLDERITGMPLIFNVLIKYIGQDGRIAAMLTICVVFLLLLFDLKSAKLALMAMVPLLVGAIWMVGLMELFGMKLDFVNVIGIPLILGIGIDDGVHIIHRYKIEGFGNIKTIYRSTGKAVLITSLTTMLAFGSLGFAVYKGLASLGLALTIGVGTAFLATVFILPLFMKKDKE